MKKILFLPILFLFSLPNFAGMQKPATKKDLALYKGIGVNYICMAGEKEVKFNKSISLASKNSELLISDRHSGYIEQLPYKKFNKNLLNNIGRMIFLEGVLVKCPDKIPPKELKKFIKFRDKIILEGRKIDFTLKRSDF